MRESLAISIELRSELGEVVDSIHDHKEVLSGRYASQLTGTRLLKYIVPWGDAVFNQAQSFDLVADIKDIQSARQSPELIDLLVEVEPLIAKLSSRSSLYLWFVGD